MTRFTCSCRGSWLCLAASQKTPTAAEAPSRRGTAMLLQWTKSMHLSVASHHRFPEKGHMTRSLSSTAVQRRENSHGNLTPRNGNVSSTQGLESRILRDSNKRLQFQPSEFNQRNSSETQWHSGVSPESFPLKEWEVVTNRDDMNQRLSGIARKAGCYQQKQKRLQNVHKHSECFP